MSGEQKPQADQDLADGLLFLGLCKDYKQCSQADNKRCIKAGLHNLKCISQLAHGNDPCRDGSTDIGTHNHAYCL